MSLREAAPAAATKFGALYHRDYRNYFLLALVGMTAESIEHVGVFNIAFTSMAQAVVQILAPPGLRGRVVGLFNTSMMGLRAGSGLTVGVLGAVIGVELSLTLSAVAVVLVALGLLAADLRRPQ
jgi:hypothetical protein